jgi:hypothetical protein
MKRGDLRAGGCRVTVYHRIGHRDRGEESSLCPRYSDSATTICPILTCDYHIIEMRSHHRGSGRDRVTSALSRPMVTPLTFIL